MSVFTLSLIRVLIFVLVFTLLTMALGQPNFYEALKGAAIAGVFFAIFFELIARFVAGHN